MKKICKMKFSLAVALAAMFLAVTSAEAQVFGGRSIGVNGTVTTNGSPSSVMFADTGQLPPTGGNITISVPSSNIPGIMTTGVLTASTSGALSSSQSVTVANDVDFRLGGIRVQANRVTSNAGCICCPGADLGACSGSVSINSLVITDVAGVQTTVTVTGAVGQTVDLPGGIGTITINEQITDLGSLTVNGMHIVAASGTTTANIVIASSTSSLECLVGNPTPGDATVSGRVLTPSGAPLARATVTLTDPEGSVTTVSSNSFGRFTFEKIEAGRTYILQASHRSYTFAPKVVTVNDDTVVDLVAN